MIHPEIRSGEGIVDTLERVVQQRNDLLEWLEEIRTTAALAIALTKRKTGPSHQNPDRPPEGKT